MKPLFLFGKNLGFCRKPSMLLSCLCALLMVALAEAPGAFGATTYYEMTVHNNFGPGEFFGATPTDAQIWLLTDYAIEYWESGQQKSLNGTNGGTYGVVQFSTIDQGKVHILRPQDGTGQKGSRFYAILSETKPPATEPSDDTTTMPYNYFEWVFLGQAPQTFDMSWIDRWDFLTRMEFSNLPENWAPHGVFGAAQGKSTAAASAAIAAYTSQPQFAWLGTGVGGFSKKLTFPGATNPIGWVTRHKANGNGWATLIGSFTCALDQMIATTKACKNTWQPGTPGTGPNWTTAGFRVGRPTPQNDPETGANHSSNEWTTYVAFEKDPDSGKYTMKLTDFTLYKNNPASGTPVWNAVTDAGGNVYEATEDQGVLECIWTTSVNNLKNSSQPAWLTKVDATNLFYAIGNAIITGVIYKDEYVNHTELPAWSGYVPYIENEYKYDFLILVMGGPVTGGHAGYLKGQDIINLQDDRRTAGDLVDPYFLELMRTMGVTPAYLYPSTDLWGFFGIKGDPPILGVNPAPLGPGDYGDNITLDWYLGGGGGQTQHHLYVSRDTEKKCGGKLPCYTTIQAAVDAASSGSTIFIAGGNYSETVSVKGSKQLTFNGNWGQTFTYQDGKTVFTKALGVEAGSSLTLQELNITP